MTNTSFKALIAIDFVNELVDPKGKLSGKGYADFLAAHGTLDRVSQLFAAARSKSLPIFHIRVGFSPDYREQPAGSPLFGPARQNGIFTLGEWGTEFHPKAAPVNDETQLIKHRVNAFYGTPLDLILRNAEIDTVLVCGVATDLAVQTAARDAHDRDYKVTVVSDCCAAANDEDHRDALRLLSKVAAITPLSALELT